MMKVYYESSLWQRDRNRDNKNLKKECGKAQKINWAFKYLGQQCYVPYIYRFKEGIIFDIVTIVEAEALQAYHKKSREIDFNDSKARRTLKEENPYQSMHIAEIWINEEKVEKGYRASGQLYTPLQYIDESYQTFKKAYRDILKDKIHFGIERFCVPYPQAAVGFEKFKRLKKRENIVSLRLMTYPVHKYYPLEKSFKLSSMQPDYAFEIKHPLTERQHTLSFRREEESSLPMQGREIYVTLASCQVEPPLKEGESLDFDSSISYTSSVKSEVTYAPEAIDSIGIIGGSDKTKAEASTDIIGGAYGATSIVIGEKSEEKSCFSKLTFESQEVAEFELRGMQIKIMEQQTYEYRRA